MDAGSTPARSIGENTVIVDFKNEIHDYGIFKQKENLLSSGRGFYIDCDKILRGSDKYGSDNGKFHN